MVDVTASLDAATQQVLALLAQIKLSNVRFVQAQDIGAADTYQIAPVPSVMGYGPDLVLLVDITSPNLTTTPKLAIQGLPFVAIQAVDGSPPAVGSISGKRLFGFASLAGGGYAARALSLLPVDVLALIAAAAKPGLKVAQVFGTNGYGGNTITGNVVVPAGCTFMDFDLAGGGGGSGGASQSGGSTPGAGSGMHAKGEGFAVTPGQSLPYVLGGGGLGGSAAGGAGGPGGYSSFMGVTAFGGGASSGNTSTSPATSGAGVGGVGSPFSGPSTAANTSFETGSSGGTPTGSSQGGYGASCPFGGGTAPPGSQGSTPGGGAGGVAGVAGGKAGSPGGDGRLIVRFY